MKKIKVKNPVVEMDLAILIRPDHPFLSTEEFMDAIDTGLKRRLS